jgi:hypothetical protein
MLLTACEGRNWRYEICEHSDGYLVQMRDLDTGELDAEFATIFRTMPVAFAYAEMSAAFDCYAAAELESAPDEQAAIDLERRERVFIDMSERLGDSGIRGDELQSWERRSDSGSRQVYH